MKVPIASFIGTNYTAQYDKSLDREVVQLNA